MRNYRIVKMSDKKRSLFERFLCWVIVGKQYQIKFMRTDYYGFTIYTLIVDGKIIDLENIFHLTSLGAVKIKLKSMFNLDVPYNEIIFESHNNAEEKAEIQNLQIGRREENDFIHIPKETLAEIITKKSS